MDDIEYFTARAADEREKAETCADPQIAKLHKNMADLYDQAVEKVRAMPSAKVTLLD